MLLKIFKKLSIHNPLRKHGDLHSWLILDFFKTCKPTLHILDDSLLAPHVDKSMEIESRFLREWVLKIFNWSADLRSITAKALSSR